ncbi:MAG: hypothetical protein OQK82_03270 [Candidatus Pacearchaeota archaeon]|nr:hypothetical protein [Candidatus Pacearchaeota archaeon]
MKSLFILLVQVILLLSFTLAYFSGHNASEIMISVDGYQMSLQDAYDGRFLKDEGGIPNSETNLSSTISHSGESLQIYLKNIGRLSLQNALNQNKSFCRDKSEVLSWVFDFGHSADEILFNDGETLQQKIDSQEFCNYKWEAQDFTECSNSCGVGTRRRVEKCRRSDGLILDDSFCLEEEKDLSEEICKGGVGTDCGFSAWKQTKTCSKTCGVGTYKRTRVCQISSEYCSGGKVDYNGAACSKWSYSWKVGDWERRGGCAVSGPCKPGGIACHGGSGKNKVGAYGLRDVWCERCDGARVGDSYCGSGKPSTTIPSCDKCSCTTVLCTEAHRQGYLSDELLKVDEEFAKKYISEKTLMGYHSWAKPLVEIMQESPEVSERLIPLIVAWAEHMSYLMDNTNTNNEAGEKLLKVGLPLSKELGEIMSEHGYTKNNEYLFKKEIVEELFWKYFAKYTKEELLKPGIEKQFSKDMENLLNDLAREYKINSEIKNKYL